MYKEYGKTIVEIASQFGLTMRTLRFYEDRGLLSPTRVGTTRFYSEKDERRVQTICHARRMGFSVAEIAAVLSGSNDPSDTPEFLRLIGRETIQRQIQHLERQRRKTLESISELRRYLRNI